MGGMYWLLLRCTHSLHFTWDLGILTNRALKHTNLPSPTRMQCPGPPANRVALVVEQELGA